MGLGFFFLRDPAARSGAPANGSPRTVAAPAHERRSRGIGVSGYARSN
jgi:hypothetical protein